MNTRTKTAFEILQVAVILGVLGDILLRVTPWGLNVTLFVTAFAAGTHMLMWRRAAQYLTGQTLALFGAFVFFGAMFVWRDSIELRVADTFALLTVGSVLFLPRMKVPTQVALELGYQGHSVMERARLESTLFHWAGNPARLDVSATVPVALFAAFGLPWPFARTNQIPSPAPPRPQQPSGPTPTAAPVPAVAPTPAISAYGQVIEEWSPDVRIAQTFAHRTRTLLTTALQQRLDMSELALQGLRIETRLFWLPPEGTVSNPGQGQLHVRVANPDSPIPASVRAGLQALDRWEVHGKRWDYTDAESDYARADVLLDDLENRLMPMLLDETESEVSILLSALHRQSLVAGLGGSAAPEEAPLRLVCLDAPADLAIRDDDVTPVVRKGLEERRKALAQRGTLQSRLRACSSCFQGTGNKPFAVDSDRIKKAWRRDLPERWTLGLKLREDITSDAADVLERLSPGSLDVVLRVFAPAVESVRPTVAAAFGAEHARGSV